LTGIIRGVRVGLARFGDGVAIGGSEELLFRGVLGAVLFRGVLGAVLGAVARSCSEALFLGCPKSCGEGWRVFFFGGGNFFGFLAIRVCLIYFMEDY